MKKQKRWFILGGLATAGLAVGLITPVVITQTSNSTSTEKNPLLNDIKQGVNNIFKNLNNKNEDGSLNSLFSVNSNEANSTLAKLDQSTIKKIHSVSNEFIDNYLSEVSDTKGVNDALSKFLKDKNIDISKYEDQINTPNLTTNIDNKEISSQNSSYWAGNYKTVNDFANDLNKSFKTSVIVAGVASAAAAGFWVASVWSFGAMAPWAVAATTQMATYTAQGIVFATAEQTIRALPYSALGEFLYQVKLSYDIYGIISVVRHVVDVAKIIKTVTSATSWASPVTAIAAFILETMLNTYANY
ncbi:hypothetical protein ACA758_00830 [Mycoplasmopsis agassizii]|uniref:hypothetical protein n=1 Tax=Mycoplasmopsis agassizii TaxID=33922 RepID=UPI003526C5CC